MSPPPRMPRRPRDLQRGNSLLLALIVMSALATLGTLTVVSVQSSLKTSTNDRSQSIAMYAAESGAAVAMDYLRDKTTAQWNALFSNGLPGTPLPFPSNGVAPGDVNSLLAPELNASYSVILLNNRDGGGPATDTDRRAIIHSTGNGPQGSLAVIEWEIEQSNPFDPTKPFILIGWHVVL